MRETLEETGIDCTEKLSSMQFVARATTSTLLPRRYSCAFFVLEVDESVKDRQREVHDVTPELSEIRWVPVHEALKFETVDVTAWLLGRIRDKTLLRTPSPHFTYEGAQPIVITQ